MKKIMFLHGFYASGQCVPAMVLRDAFKGRAEVITPDMLSGLCGWAFFDTNATDAIVTQFGSGCSTVVTMTIVERMPVRGSDVSQVFSTHLSVHM